MKKEKAAILRFLEIPEFPCKTAIFGFVSSLHSLGPKNVS